ncbi:sensor histidine kinase [Amphibacillus cookii]|uniref:sensor histidine kinase n=1 Tax=Amphibacillus cookii TaxID=767787 RepID=UPI00195C1B54|nr:sensor histidine kinase [Amphibacillus cookii]MBM7540874.1 NarL family two-component system sensor histidine kinase LiaS [Amphibacillus cookii]
MRSSLFPILMRSLMITNLLIFSLTILLFSQIDPLQWSMLWTIRLQQLPLGFVLVLTSVIIGTFNGFMIFFFHKRELKAIYDALVQVESKSTDEKVRYYGRSKEAYQCIAQIRQIQLHLQSARNRMQKVISERIEDQEQQIEARLTQERNRLARELHDSVSQELFAASMLVSAVNEMSEQNNEQLNQPLAQIERMIQQAQLEMRALLLHLRPIALKDHSLQEGINQLLTELVSKVPISIDWRTEPITLNRAVEDHLFRILQESLSNALRHAKATQIDVLFIKRDHVAVLSVVDDGVGFDCDSEQSGSYGLANMKERAEEIGGQYQLISVPDQGTKLDVRVPINKHEG